MDSRDLLSTLAGFVVAALVLGALAYVVGTGEVLASIRSANTAYVAVVALAIVAWICLWGTALHVVLAAGGTEVSLSDAILVNAGAAFFNHVTPFGQAGGEPVAAWLISDVADADFERALAAMTSFDTINVVPSMGFTTAGLFYYATVATLSPSLRWLGVAFFAAAFVGLVLAAATWRNRDAVEALLARVLALPARAITRAVPRLDVPTVADVEEHVANFVRGIERVADDRRRLAIAVALSAGGWIVQAAGLWVAILSLGTRVPPYVPLFVVPMGTMANVLPTPGGLGGVEALQVTLLVAATGIAAATATAAAAIFSVGGFFLTTALGAGAIGVLNTRARLFRA